MNPAPLRIGDLCQIIGPSCNGKETRIGDCFKVNTITSDSRYAGRGGIYYPAASLCKVRIVDEEELHAGDRVEIIGPAFACDASHLIGKSFDISQMPEFCRSRFECNSPIDHYSALGWPMFPASSLRKLGSAELPINSPGLVSYQKWGNWIETRLSAIESKLADLSPKDRQFSPEEIDSRNSPLSKEELEEYWRNRAACGQASPTPWTIDISRGNMHLLNSGQDGEKLGEWAKRMMEDE